MAFEIVRSYFHAAMMTVAFRSLARVFSGKVRRFIPRLHFFFFVGGGGRGGEGGVTCGDQFVHNSTF